MAKKKKKKKSKDWMRFVLLGYEILGHKFLYYEGAKYGLEATDDFVYDEIEEEYKALAKKFKREPTSTDMVGFDNSRPSCRMVKEDLIINKGKFPSTRNGVKKIVNETRKKINVYLEVLEEVLDETKLKDKTKEKILKKMKKGMKP